MRIELPNNARYLWQHRHWQQTKLSRKDNKLKLQKQEQKNNYNEGTSDSGWRVQLLMYWSKLV